MKCSRRIFPRPRASFTLVELLVAMGLGMLLMGTIYAAYFTGWRGLITMGQYQQANAKTRLVSQLFTRDARQAIAIADLNPLPDGTDITMTLPTGFDDDGTVTGTRSVRYYLLENDCQLARVDDGVETLLVQSSNCATGGVSSLTIRALDTNGDSITGASDLTSAQMVEMDLTLDYGVRYGAGSGSRTDRSLIRVKLRQS